MVNPCAGDSLERTEAALAAGNLQGVCLFPAMHRYEMNDSRAQAIVGAAAAYPGAVVFVHCGVLSVGVRKRLGLPSPFDMRYSNPIHLHATALAFPQVRFVIPHFGAGYFREVLMLCDLCPNVYLDTSSSNSWIAYEGLDLETVFRRALDIAGPQRLVFGTDSSFFPRGWQSGIFEQQAAVLSAIGVDSEAAQSIFSGNFDLLFKEIQQ
jgi:predicted TIM-barrel fold metal-dependent hydrolase